jgi:hypothetical protein
LITYFRHILARTAGSDGSYHLVNEVQNYLHRHPALHLLSPIEITMIFKLEKQRTIASTLLSLQEPYPLASSHGHNPRTKAFLPQVISELPVRPAEDGDTEEKEAYARVILANFFPYSAVDLEGDTLWEKMADWRERKPRDSKMDNGPKLDTFALRMVDNAALVSRRHILSHLAFVL